MNIKYRFEEFYYYEAGSRKYFYLKGWAFHENNQEVIVIKRNGQELEVQRSPRKDVRFKYSEYLIPELCGFEVAFDIDASEDMGVILLTVGDDELIKFTKKNLKKDSGFSKYRYAVDSINKTEHSQKITGWVTSSDNEVIDIEVYKGRKKLDAKIKRVNRNDVVTALFGTHNNEAVIKDVGFSIECPLEATSIVFIRKDGKKTISINKNQNGLMNKVKKGLKLVTPRKVVKGVYYLFKLGPKGLIEKIRVNANYMQNVDDYMTYVKNHRLDKDQIAKQKLVKFAYNPKISIVVPTYKTKDNFLNEMIDSVEEQTYGNYELCIADGSEEYMGVEKIVRERMKKNPRIVYKHLEKNFGIAGNTNEALALATGEYVALFDHDDLLSINALYEVVKALNEESGIDVLYTDEDKVTLDLKQYYDPNFKPDFSIDYLRSINYICHLFIAKKSIIDEVGGFDSNYDGSQDHDLILKCCEKANKIKHIAKILYHWRSHPDSTAQNASNKMYCFESGRKAVQDHLIRLGIKANVELGKQLGNYRVKYEVIGNPLVSIIIPTKDHIDDLDKCIQSILHKSTYSNYEIIVVENNSTEESTFEYYKQIESQDSRIKVVYWKDEFNYSAINNFGVEFSKGEYILLLNNDTEVISEDWLEEMVGNLQREEVGAVGAKLYYPDDTVQHCGVLVGMDGIAGHLSINATREDSGYFCRNIVPSNVSACTAACLMIKASVYKQINGLDPKFKVAFNDVDLCLRIREAGYLIVMDPYVELYHYESKSRGYEDTPEKVARFNNEIAAMQERYSDFFEAGDPYYNPNLCYVAPGFKVKVD